MANVQIKVIDVNCRFCSNPAIYKLHHNRMLKYNCKKCKHEFWVSTKTGLMLSEFVNLIINKKEYIWSVEYDINILNILTDEYESLYETTIKSSTEFQSIKEIENFIKNLLLLG